MVFTEEELLHLMRSWIGVTLTFSIIYSRSLYSLGVMPVFIISGFTVGLAFILHEIAHKLVAQKLGCWAEFRSSNMGLVLAIILALIGSFVFISPGAVLISGSVSKEKNGKIGLAGPLINIILAFIFHLLFFLLSSNVSLWWRLFFDYGKSINSWLAFFNLLPIGILDGAKIFKWSVPVWIVSILTAFALTFGLL